LTAVPAAAAGSFDDLLGVTAEPLRPVLAALRDVIRGVHPEACEVVRMGDRAATYGVGPRKMRDGYAYLMPHRAWVNLGFYQGAALPDPDGLLDGTGAKMRHVKVRTLAEARRPALRALIAAALAARRAAAGADRCGQSAAP
jgi:hypothetical protein